MIGIDLVNLCGGQPDGQPGVTGGMDLSEPTIIIGYSVSVQADFHQHNGARA